jgi:hypothetical protein
MKVLFLGGTGVISSACSRLAVNRGIDLYLFNRGQTARPIPEGARILHGDIRDGSSLERALGDTTFDVVANFVNFTPEHVEADIKLFRDRTGQYILISSASAYQKPLSSLPITESTPLDNPFWAYSRAKIACEERLMRAYREDKFPITIVRPSHTYDRTKVPLLGHYTDIDRMRKGEKVIVHGDGTSLWVLTHHEDFAKGFVFLLRNIRLIKLLINRHLLAVPAVRGEVNYYDLLILEIVRLRCPEIYEAICLNLERFTYLNSINWAFPGTDTNPVAQFYDGLVADPNGENKQAVLSLLSSVFFSVKCYHERSNMIQDDSRDSYYREQKSASRLSWPNNTSVRRSAIQLSG